MISTSEAKQIIKKIGLKLRVSPALISTRLISAQDKCDMLNGDISVEALEQATGAWMDAGMPDYSNGLTSPMRKS